MDFCPFKRRLTSNFSGISNKLISCEEDMFMSSLICSMDVDCNKLLVCKMDMECMKTLQFDTEVSLNPVLALMKSNLLHVVMFCNTFKVL
ncbi:hypothetical protein DKX38_027489 [Salix brachista]|uniref:Uncharacterized protein n=1 Tax=Salix brachista TaxID=2182728 RepID=A0A5N5JC96_9ROSI|nr:hypothetical protein DKX38_027489 [Salix brachista]